MLTNIFWANYKNEQYEWISGNNHEYVLTIQYFLLVEYAWDDSLIQRIYEKYLPVDGPKLGWVEIFYDIVSSHNWSYKCLHR